MAVFLGVPLVIYLVFVISPFAQSIYYSLTDWSGFSSTMNFVGLRNFRALLSDDLFLRALRNNVILLIALPIFTLVVALIFASLVTVAGSSRGQVRGLRNSGLYRVVSFFPYVIPGIVIGLIWAQIYDPSAGLLNGILTGLGFDRFESYPWLGDERTAMAASIFAMAWGGIGFYMVLFIAAIRGIDPQYYEAMRLDGAGRFSTAIHLTLPLIRDNVQTAYIYLGIAALDGFVFMQALNPAGGPDNSTLVMGQLLFRTAFTQGKFGYATAMGVALAIVTLAFAALVFTVNRLTGADKDTGR
ncbi:sugar ABC transporter permease [Microlunatus elymi]|uniref:Sugar ABC transporter permease n=2 Tax=Microlunatus elymi TaxID=2596828 RepID=A0A516Q5P9_9ACTN|nr:sugar ABC transporter permease [Microlunatus elymi]